MKNTLKFLAFILLAVVFAIPSSAQTILTPTTLSAAVTSTASGPGGPFFFPMQVTSATGIVAQTTPSTGSVCIVDAEAVDVRYINGTLLGVVRAQHGTRLSTHNSGALFWCGQLGNAATGAISQIAFSDSKQGSCTRTNEQVLPHISLLGTPATVNVYDCIGGQWVASGFSVAGVGLKYFQTVVPPVGATLYTGINTNGTAMSATTYNCVGGYVPTGLITSIGALAGTTVGTDKWYYALVDPSTGLALANTAVAGATTSGATTFQFQALTTPYYAVGANYFVCMQSNGSTDTVRMAVTGQLDTFLTKAQTGATFGTIPTLVPPTTFTTAVGPVFALK